MSTEPLQVLFLGTGTSTTLPLTPCLTNVTGYPSAWNSVVPSPSTFSTRHKNVYNPKASYPTNIPCYSCRAAVDQTIPEGWKNRRGNTSVIIRRKVEGVWRNLLVDCGKSFVDSSRRLFPGWGVKSIDAVLLTHGHADAYFGLDDLREWCIRQSAEIPIYLNKETYNAVAASFPYLVDKTQASGGGDIPTLVWHVIDDFSTFEIHSIPVLSVPVHHGVYFREPKPDIPIGAVDQSSLADTRQKPQPQQEPLICLAFMFDGQILYIGDVNEIPEESYNALLNRQIPTNGHSANHEGLADGAKRLFDEGKVNAPMPRTEPTTPDHAISKLSISSPTPSASLHSNQQPHPSTPPLPILIVDALWPNRAHVSHYSLAQAYTTALRLNPQKAFILGTTHPTSQFMWEEVCLSFKGLDGKRTDHPEAEATKNLVERVKGHQDFKGEGGLGERIRDWKGSLEPAWDGLVLKSEGVEGEVRVVEGEGGCVRGWSS